LCFRSIETQQETIIEVRWIIHAVFIENERVGQSADLQQPVPVGGVSRQAGNSFDAEFRVIWPEGSVHWLRGKGTVLVDDSGLPIRTMGVIEDVTQRKQTEAKLRESEERFRNMADTAPVMIWVAGPDKLCTFFNKCCLDFTGQSLEQKIGYGWIAGVHPEDREQFLAKYSSSLDARQGFQTVFRLRRADDEYRWVLTTGIPRFGPGGVFAGFIGSCVDVTEIKRANEQLQTAYSEIEQLKQRLEQDNLYLQEEIKLEHHGVVGRSEKVRKVLKKVEQVVKTDASVLILGETGTGKELIARAIHAASNRNQRPMVKINCAALPAALVESELFGRERGAYTGALTREIGRFELANGSTLFLDEIGELPLDLQAKLLRVLQEGEFERLAVQRPFVWTCA
jgi:formate hydrogenlyase transcriptional activator